jgi:hypothetical protein
MNDAMKRIDSEIRLGTFSYAQSALRQLLMSM